MAIAGVVLGGRYDLEERIGRGGYGEVWRAHDGVLSRPVAVKLLYPGLAGQPWALARFQAEARHAGSLSHQNIARVYDYGESADEASPYLIMELIDGPSLSDVLSSGPLDVARSMDIVAQAAAGLQAAHSTGLVHRDIKPANLLLDSGGTVKITDFGIAHAIGSAPVTVTGELLGTSAYLAPELVAGMRATSASDLYALGIAAYECLTGTAPFQGTQLEIALAHDHRPLPPLPPSVPPDVAAFVIQLTAKDPAERPGSATDVALRASRLRDGLGAGVNPQTVATARVPVRQSRQPKRGPARRRAVLVLAVMVLAGVSGLALTSLNGRSPGSSPISVPPSSTQSARVSPGTRAPVTSTTAPPVGGTGASPVAAVSQQPTTVSSNQPGPSGTSPTSPSAKPSHKKGKGHGGGNGNGNGKNKG
jgi:eukaryotic-like serine/threonine-protein kinase